MNLSASALNVFNECPRCFYEDRKNKRPRPRGIFPSLPGGMDRVFKEWVDGLRSGSGEVPTLQTDKGPHKLFADAVLLKKWQNWRSGLKWEDGKGNAMIGALDDVLVNAVGQLVPFDYKTKGSATNQADVEKYYQRQVDIYALLLSTHAEVANYGFILSHWPLPCEDTFQNGGEAHIEIPFMVDTFCLSANPERAKELFARAIQCLSSDIMPPSGPGCEYCKFATERMDAALV